MPDYKADYNRKFCRICVNSEYDLESGIICGLTKKKADFIESCPDFIPDQNELQEAAINADIHLKAHHFTYTKISELDSIEGFADKKTVVTDSKSRSLNFLILMIIATLGMTIHVIVRPDQHVLLSKIGIPLTFALGAFLGYRNYKNPKTTLIIDHKGFQIDGERVYWVEVSELVLQHKQRKHSFYFELYWYLTNGISGSKSFPDTDIGRDDLRQLLKSHWKNSGAYFSVSP